PVPCRPAHLLALPPRRSSDLAPPPAYSPGPGGSSSKVMPVLVGLLLVLTGVNLYLAISTRSKFSDQMSLQNDQLILLARRMDTRDRKSTRLNSSHQIISYAVF